MESGHVSLNVLIVGAGLAGLSAAIACAQAGHDVVVLEAAKQLSEVCHSKSDKRPWREHTAGGISSLQSSNKHRTWKVAMLTTLSWGLKDGIEQVGCEPRILAVHRYADGMTLAREEGFDQQMRQKYGSPFIDVHRGDLHTMLCQKASDLGVKIRTDSRVSEIDIAQVSVQTESGATFSGDLIVGADGLWSKCREAMLGQRDPPLPTGDLAYRIVLSLEQVKHPELRGWIQNPACHFWAGPDAHAVGYSVKSGQVYNLVLLCPDNLPENVSRQEGSIEEMKELFNSWDPILTRFLDHVEKVDKWKLMYRAELERWTNDQGTFTLIGDSCHPMLPYLAQGANSAIEDGAALGAVLENLVSRSDLKSRIKLWEKVRKVRGEAIARETFEQRRDFHLSDGLEQKRRDEIFHSQLGKPVSVRFPSRWSCPVVQPWLYGYNAIEEVKKMEGRVVSQI